MNEYRAPVIDLFTRERLDLHLVQSPDDLDAAERDYLWQRLEATERLAEHYRRRLGLIGLERGLGEQDN